MTKQDDFFSLLVGCGEDMRKRIGRNAIIDMVSYDADERSMVYRVDDKEYKVVLK